ncbi:MAG: 7-cyano-7-deazaguanine synthase QueC [Methanocalculus sp. MSAO_Arc1]|uniref:7-cyano-7-deazaguanine synthase QueC n=1 Tax=Methanocalculus TaxID=71151 RepID=UPI000FF604B7|nr:MULTISPECIES: 7-cyano-7-deazaguanine synthase QueC [unclassified Methanocalculus]MCP1662662.1 7-cyano-7-deazaguanine synthase [Methanocalculus sp. AMF5]RQD80307.1 MAG: 7-cyano-7-deazaguanine synthase QueC [Methanocalculus sp. MSAO_Arc1]
MKAVCLLSGGMDSATLAYYAKNMGYDLLPLHITYGQRTETRELRSARRIADLLGTEPPVVISLDYFRIFGASSLTDPGMAVETHEESSGTHPNTYVPFRNANLLAIATSFCEARGGDAVFIGVQAGDYAGYPDCRLEFIEAFQRVIDLGTMADTPIRIMAPFAGMNKTEILKEGLSLGVPYAETWSCYQDNDPACGICSSCHYRLLAFRAVGIDDPITYREQY